MENVELKTKVIIYTGTILFLKGPTVITPINL